MKNMKKVMSLSMAVAMLLSGGIMHVSAGEPLDIMYVAPGSLGDLSMCDNVMRACEQYVEENGGSINTFECANDTSLYEPSMLDCCGAGEYDLIITGNYNLVDAVNIAAEQYPDQKILVYDAEVSYEDGKNQNIISYQAKQNECAFLAGALSALVTSSDEVELANADKKVGFVGGGENTAIQDFMVGFIEGVNYVDSSIEVMYSFVGNWTDTALAKELALTQFQQGADVVFAVCGTAGLGVMEAARESNAYAIACDSDLATQLKDTNPETAEHIITSAVKDFQTLTYKMLNEVGDGTAEWGTHIMNDYANGGVILIDNEYYQSIVPESVQTEYQAVLEKLAAGEIEIGTAIGATPEEIDAFKEAAKPF